MNLKEKFGLNVKYYRYMKKLKQSDIAEEVSKSNVYISEIERGMHSPDFDLIEQLAKSLGVEPYELFLKPKEYNFPRRIDMLEDYKEDK